MDGEAVKAAVITALDYSYLHDSWVTPLDEALAGLSIEDARRRITPGSRCIWEIVLHLAVWTENIVIRMETGEKARPVEGAWPPLPGSLTDDDWEAARARLTTSLSTLHDFLAARPPEGLLVGPWGLADLLCRFTHLGYHIGQITKIRECACGRVD